MKLYIDIDYKDEEEMFGTIFSKPRKNEKEFYLRYNAKKQSENVFILTLSVSQSGKKYVVTLEKGFDCNFSARHILMYVNERFEFFKKYFFEEM